MAGVGLSNVAACSAIGKYAVIKFCCREYRDHLCGFPPHTNADEQVVMVAGRYS
jgi:hypothetical protein